MFSYYIQWPPSTLQLFKYMTIRVVDSLYLKLYFQHMRRVKNVQVHTIGHIVQITSGWRDGARAHFLFGAFTHALVFVWLPTSTVATVSTCSLSSVRFPPWSSLFSLCEIIGVSLLIKKKNRLWLKINRIENGSIDFGQNVQVRQSAMGFPIAGRHWLCRSSHRTESKLVFFNMILMWPIWSHSHLVWILSSLFCCFFFSTFNL